MPTFDQDAIIIQDKVALPNYEIPGQTKTFDLLDWVSATDMRVRTPLRVALAESVPSMIQNRMRSSTIQRQIEEITPRIRAALAGRKAGYLLRVNLYAQDQGTIFSPAGSIIASVGIGLEPIDALAEAYRLPAVRAPQPTALRDVSMYFWMNVRHESDGRTHLVGTHIPSELSRAFEQQARAEAERRELVNAAFLTPASDAFVRLHQAEHWNRVYSERQRAIADASRRQEVWALNARFNAAEQRFNDAYEGYQKVERQMAAYESEMAVINAIDGVLTLTKAGLEAHAQLALRSSSNPDSRQSAMPAPINNGNISLWREARQQVLGGIRQTITVEVRNDWANLIGAQAELKDAWNRAGVPVPREPPINIELP